MSQRECTVEREGVGVGVGGDGMTQLGRRAGGKRNLMEGRTNIPFAGSPAACRAPQSSPRPIECCAEGGKWVGVVVRRGQGIRVEERSLLPYTQSRQPLPSQPPDRSHVPSSALLLLVVVAHLVWWCCCLLTLEPGWV